MSNSRFASKIRNYSRPRNPFNGQPIVTPGRTAGSQGRGKVSSINPNQLIKRAIQRDEVEFVPGWSFDQTSLHARLKKALHQKGYTSPTEIQEKTIGTLIQGRDLLGVAKTGTGKTAAYLIPVIHRLLSEDRPFQSLILVPTRELALQVEGEFNSLTKGMGFAAACFVGGKSISNDFRKLRMMNHLVVGTPGRLIDLMNRGALRLNSFTLLVIDEFDRMLDMGFIQDVNRIVAAVQDRKQTLLFSATLDKTQRKMIDELLTNPVEVNINCDDISGDHIDQDIIRVGSTEDKFAVLLQLLQQEGFTRVLLFADTKRMVERMGKQLQRSGIRTEVIHGDKSQFMREKALNNFKKGQVQVLVATDVAARGLDISDVTHVINYQLPRDYESYVHRIGRTGRAGKEGKAFTFVN
ncbi:MAG TPA: DEAD/DEAH box helicase [Bacteroidales bacterium]|nr:DEAD/DEAH box helicase [Bacteroidales bacterium]HNS47374.1 DEAD/DEAH box helicase [Bacteroidales bacterium]